MGAKGSKSEPILPPVLEANYLSIIPGDIIMIIGSYIGDHKIFQQMKQLYPNISQFWTKQIAYQRDLTYKESKLIPFVDSKSSMISSFTLLSEYYNVEIVESLVTVSSFDQLIKIAQMPKLRVIHLLLEGPLDYTNDKLLEDPKRTRSTTSREIKGTLEKIRGTSIDIRGTSVDIRGTSIEIKKFKEDIFSCIVLKFLLSFLQRKSIQATLFPDFDSQKGTTIDIRTSNVNDLRFYYYGCLGGLLSLNSSTIECFDRNQSILNLIKSYKIPFQGLVFPEDLPNPAPKWLSGHKVYGHTENSSRRVYEHLFYSYINTKDQTLVSYVNPEQAHKLILKVFLACGMRSFPFSINLTGTLPSLFFNQYPGAASMSMFDLSLFAADIMGEVNMTEKIDEMLKRGGKIYMRSEDDQTREYKTKMEQQYPNQIIDLDSIGPSISIDKSLMTADLRM